MNLYTSKTSQESNIMISYQSSQISTRADCQIKISNQSAAKDITTRTSFETEVKRIHLGKDLEQLLDSPLLSVDEPSRIMDSPKSRLFHDFKNLETSESSFCFPSDFNSTHRICSRKMLGKPTTFRFV